MSPDHGASIAELAVARGVRFGAGRTSRSVPPRALHALLDAPAELLVPALFGGALDDLGACF